MLEKLSKYMVGTGDNSVRGVTPWQDVGFLQKFGMGLGGAGGVRDYKQSYAEAQKLEDDKLAAQAQKSKLAELAASQDPNAMQQAAAGQSYEALGKYGKSLQAPKAGFEGTGFDAQMVNMRAKEILATNPSMSPEKALKQAANDVLATKSDVITTPEGTFSVPRRGLPDGALAKYGKTLGGKALPKKTGNNIDVPAGFSEGATRLAPPAPEKPLTRTQSNEFRESRDQLQAGLDAVREIRKDITENPSKAGALGSLRGGYETVTGVASDVAGYIPELGGLIKGATGIDISKKGGDTVKGLSPLENKLALAVARARQGGNGRILSKPLEKAQKDVKLQGFTSSSQVLDALDAIESELSGGLTGLSGRAGDVGLDLKVKKKVLKYNPTTGDFE